MSESLKSPSPVSQMDGRDSGNADALDILDMPSYLRGLAEEGPLHFLPNPGNAGDAMIAHATYCLFEKHQLPYEIIDPQHFDSSGRVVLYGGGGWSEGGEMAMDFIKRNHAGAKRLVLLPHTNRKLNDLLNQFGSNVDVIARERVTYQHSRRQAHHANVMLAHDLAFHLDVDQLLAMEFPRWLGEFAPKRRLRRLIMRFREVIRRKFFGATAIHCQRQDSEKTDVTISCCNSDLSKLFKCGGLTPLLAAKSSRMVFDQINLYEEVHTNRLHLAVASALLGKRVIFGPNSYYKNQAVYEFSMRDKFPKVQWVGDEGKDAQR